MKITYHITPKELDKTVDNSPVLVIATPLTVFPREHIYIVSTDTEIKKYSGIRVPIYLYPISEEELLEKLKPFEYTGLIEVICAERILRGYACVVEKDTL